MPRIPTLALASLFFIFFVPASSFSELPPLLTTVNQVRSEPPDQAESGQPVLVRGVVLGLSGWKNSFFFSDGKIGISIDRNDTLPELHSGDEVEVAGKTAAGKFAPVIVADTVRVLGHSRLPPAQLRTYTELAGGTEDSQWVEVRGVVHAAWIAQSWGREVLFLDVDLGGAQITARIHDFSIRDASYLVDAEVRVRGVCGTNFNERRQIVGLRLFVTDMNAVTVERPAPADPFSLALEDLDAIQRFNPGRSPQHRVRVSGTVTYQKLGETLYLQNGATGLYVQTNQPTPVAPGDKIEVVGFSALGAYSPQLRSAIFRIAGPGEPPAPLPLTAAQMIRADSDGFLSSIYDALLVQLHGRLVERVSRAEEEVFVIRDGDRLFRAYLPNPSGATVLSWLRPGSDLQLTGVASIQSDESREPHSFELLLRSADDIVILHAPPWWDLQHKLYLLGLASLVTLISVAYVALLRRQVRRQVELVRRSLADREAALRDLAQHKFALDQYISLSTTNREGAIISVNERFCALSQYSRQELIGQDHRILNSGHHPKEFFQEMYRTISSGQTWHGEIKNRAKDGSLYWVDATIVPTVGADGKPLQYVAIRLDITERKLAEAALEESRNSQIRLKDEFLSHVSHELRSPLTAIKQFTNILLGGMAGELNADQLQYQQIVLKNVLQLQSMIDDLLEVTRLETGKLSVELESISVSDAATDAVNTIRLSARAKRISVSCDVPPDFPSAYADQIRLRQILIILLDNAVKFTPEGGAIKIQARRLPQDPQFLLLEVSDTGCGMNPEATEKIFDRLYQISEFSQAGRKGMGIGLFICKELVTRHGGQIWVKSQTNVGSIFSFTLPVFSLSKVIAPLLVNEKWPADSVALVMVETRFIGSTPPAEKVQQDWLSEARSLVAGCLMPKLDVLLPRIAPSASGECIFAAAFADDKGAVTLSNRIREQFERLPHSKRPELGLFVSYKLLRPMPCEAASTQDILTNMATLLEGSIKSQICSEVIYG